MANVARGYIVEFDEAVARFEANINAKKHDLPTIDVDSAKWCMMSAFEKPNPLPLIDQTAYDLAYRGWLVSGRWSDALSPFIRRQEESMMQAYVYNCLLEMGQLMYEQIKGVGLYRTGNEQYKINNSIIDNDTYILQPV